jgi:hypothetical protein
MPDHQRQDFIECAEEIISELIGRVLTVSQQGPVLRLDYATTEEAERALDSIAHRILTGTEKSDG